MAPYAHIGNALAESYGAMLLTQSPRLGGEPFTIYELPSASNNVSPKPQAFDQNIQAAGNGSIRYFADDASPWIISDWQQLQARDGAYNTTYSYRFTALSSPTSNREVHSACTFSTINTGDHILAALQLTASQVLSRSMTMRIASSNETPENPVLGPFHMETHRRLQSPERSLQTANGKISINLPIS
jgi:hypothetical protein